MVIRLFHDFSWHILGNPNGVTMGNDEELVMNIGSVPWLREVLSLPSLPMDPRKVGHLGVPWSSMELPQSQIHNSCEGQ